ncbi:MAG TPA: M20/M25/M40 family metallo-hydrolase [Baekduia sp.]
MSRAILAALACVCALGAPAASASAAAPVKKPKPQPDYSAQLQKAVTVQGMLRHERALANIAERNGGTRASGTTGFAKSRDYVVGQLQNAGYTVTVQPFDFPFFQETQPSTLERTGDGAKTYTQGPDGDFNIMQYSGSGDVTAPVTPVDVTLPPPAEPGSTSGCEASDFAGFPAGNVALIQRGTCTFSDKVDNAVAAGASAVIIFNEGQEGRTDSQGGTLGTPKDVPVLFASFDAGNELATAAAAGPVTLHVVTTTINETRETYNVLADTKKGDASKTVVVGSHLDSVLEGPGINDDGSGTAQDLEIALQLPKILKKPVNKIRFAFWGAEESGLLGSTHYVEGLTQEQKDDIMANLNFDMVASPNYARLIYDGDGSDNPDTGPGPVGSDIIESVLAGYWDAKGLAHQSTAFDGRSDYGPFIDAGIPAGGTFSGAEEIKTAEEVQKYGGTAGEAYDHCYHQACDNLQNLNLEAFDEFSDNAANAVVTLAQRQNDLTDNTPQTLAKRAPAVKDYKGPDAIR